MAGIDTHPSFNGPSGWNSSPKVIVPVKTEATYSTGPIMVGFIIIVILVGVALFLYTRNHHTESSHGGEQMNITIKNLSQLPYVISLPSKTKINLEKDKETKVSLAQYDIIKAMSYTYDGQKIEHEFKISNPKIKTVYISPSGFSSNISSMNNVEFVNNSRYPVLFIERSENGSRRWGTDIIPPLSKSKGHFMAQNTVWEVTHPTDENTPLDQITVGGKINQLIYDENGLKAI